jgi:hypothetical protein
VCEYLYFSTSKEREKSVRAHRFPTSRCVSICTSVLVKRERRA